MLGRSVPSLLSEIQCKQSQGVDTLLYYMCQGVQGVGCQGVRVTRVTKGYWLRIIPLKSLKILEILYSREVLPE
jgi:hypothetical protein